MLRPRSYNASDYLNTFAWCCELTHAHPAELIFAFLTGHMANRGGQRRIHKLKAFHALASTVLLNCTLALAALLRVTLDPVGSLTIVLTLLEPHLSHATHHRSMIIVDITAEAELVGIRCSACDDRHNRRESRFGCGVGAGNGVCARRIWTVLQTGIAGDELSHEKLLKAIPCGLVVL